MRRFLVIQTAFIGDVILALPVAQALHGAFPEAEIHLLVRRGNEPLLANHPAVHRTWVWDKGRKYQSLHELLWALRAYRFEAVFNLHRFASSGWITLWLRAENKIGFAKNPFSWAYRHRIAHPIGQVHETERNLALVRAFLPGAPVERPKLYPSADDTDAALHALGGSWPAPYVVLAPTSVWFTKQWPLPYWQELIGLLPKAFTVVLVGGPSDHAVLETLADPQNPERVRNLAGKLSLLQSAAVMARAHRVIANDSAPLHLASAVNCPSTAIFCSTVPSFGFGPLADGSQVVETTDVLSCRPCGLHGYQECPKGHFRCGWGVLPAQVARTVGD